MRGLEPSNSGLVKEATEFAEASAQKRFRGLWKPIVALGEGGQRVRGSSGQRDAPATQLSLRNPNCFENLAKWKLRPG